MLTGYVGLIMSTNTNCVVTLKMRKTLAGGFEIAYRGGLVMGYFLCGIGILNLLLLILAYKKYYLPEDPTREDICLLLECVSGYGLGGSTVALFARVGGGIFTKSADIGADLVGKIHEGLDEDSPLNPAVIADNVGDNVGDIAGMGADLFGSFAESTSATLVISGTSAAICSSWNYLLFPLVVSSVGLLVCFFISFFGI